MNVRFKKILVAAIGVGTLVGAGATGAHAYGGSWGGSGDGYDGGGGGYGDNRVVSAPSYTNPDNASPAPLREPATPT